MGSPRVLVLDEPTSALDGRSESLVRRTLTELRGTMTVIIISHRLATVEDCDLLLVLENGRVADYGLREEVVLRAPFRRAAEASFHEPLGGEKEARLEGKAVIAAGESWGSGRWS